MPAKFDRHGNGVLEDGVFNIVYQPLLDDDDRCTGILVHAVELTGGTPSPSSTRANQLLDSLS